MGYFFYVSHVRGHPINPNTNDISVADPRVPTLKNKGTRSDKYLQWMLPVMRWQEIKSTNQSHMRTQWSRTRCQILA